MPTFTALVKIYLTKYNTMVAELLSSENFISTYTLHFQSLSPSLSIITASNLTKERWDKSERCNSKVTKLQAKESTSDIESQLDHINHQTTRNEMIKETEAEAPGDIDIQVSPLK